jgi:hypothetical protein
MIKAEIIAATLREVSKRGSGLTVGFEDTPRYERHVRAELQRRLASIEPGRDTPTCANFTHLGVECCHICHVEYPEYELALIEIESGGRAWLCCPLDRALNPSKHAAMEQSPEWQELVRLFSFDLFRMDKSACGYAKQ